MTKKPKVSLRPVVDEIEKLLKELESLDEPASTKDRHRAKALKATARGDVAPAALRVLEQRRERHRVRVPCLIRWASLARQCAAACGAAPHVLCTWQAAGKVVQSARRSTGVPASVLVLDILDRLDSWTDIDALAAVLELPDAALSVLLDGLLAHDLVEVDVSGSDSAGATGRALGGVVSNRPSVPSRDPRRDVRSS